MKRYDLCIEHGSLHNTGDYAMLWNVVRKLRQRCGTLRIAVRRDEAEASMPLEDVSTFPSLMPYYCAIPASWLGQRIGPRGCQILVLLATIRLLAACWILRIFRTPALFPRQTRGFVNAVRSCRVFFVAGHGGVTEAWLYSAVYGLHAEMLLARQLGAQVIASGQGLGPLHARLGSFFIRKAFRACDTATVRDADSLDLLTATAQKFPHVQVAADDAADLPLDSQRLAAKRQQLLTRFEGVSQLWALCIRPKSTARREPQDLEAPAAIIRALIRDPTSAVILIPMLTDNEIERSFHQRLEKHLASPRVQWYGAIDLDPLETLHTIGACDAAIGHPYHFAMFALATGCPILALCETPYYEKKMGGLQAMYQNPPMQIVDPEKLNAAEIVVRCHRLAAARKTQPATLVGSTEAYAAPFLRTQELLQK